MDLDAVRRCLARHDGAGALAVLDGLADAPDVWLLRAAALRWTGATTTAVEAARAAVACADEPARRGVQAARVMFNGSVLGVKSLRRVGLLHHDLLAAEDLVRASLAEAPSASGWRLLADVLEGLGRPSDCLAAWDAAVACAPDDREVRARAIRRHLVEADPEGAWRLVDATVPSALVAEVAVAGRREDAADWVSRATDAPWVDRVRWAWAVGDVEGAAREIAEHGDGAARARWALWCGDDATAQAAVDGARGPAADGVRGALAVRAGEPALGWLDLSLRGEIEGWHERSALLAWRAEARLAANDRVGAKQDAMAAMAAADVYHLPAHLLRLCAVVDPRGDDLPLDQGAWHHFRPKLAAYLDEVPPVGATQAEVLTAAREVLTRMAGNRSLVPTRLHEGGVVPVDVPEHARAAARALEHGLRWSPVDAVVARYAELQARHPDDPTPHTYCGEVLVWSGRYAAAREQFIAALGVDRTTTWAWIGLGACDLLSGDPEAALDTWTEGVAASRYEGPTLFAYRGEAWWRLGDLARATRDLDIALRDKPQRMTAWILRALVAAEEGALRPAAVVARQIRTHAPGLWIDASAEGRAPDEALRAILALLRGNRSSTMVTWFLDDASSARMVWWSRDWLTQRHLWGAKR